MEEKKSSWTFFNQTVCALRFLYGQTLKVDWPVKQIPFPRQERRLPEVLSLSEVSKFLSCVSALLYRTIFQIHPTAVQRACRKAAQVAGINKRVTPHMLRHSF